MSGAMNSQVLLDEMHGVIVDLLNSFDTHVEVLAHFRVFVSKDFKGQSERPAKFKQHLV